MTDVTIEYCEPCGFLDSAVETQVALLERFGETLDSVALQPGDSGVFEVHVDEETIWDKDTHGTEVDTELIGDTIDDRLEPADT